MFLKENHLPAVLWLQVFSFLKIFEFLQTVKLQNIIIYPGKHLLVMHQPYPVLLLKQRIGTEKRNYSVFDMSQFLRKIYFYPYIETILHPDINCIIDVMVIFIINQVRYAVTTFINYPESTYIRNVPDLLSGIPRASERAKVFFSLFRFFVSAKEQGKADA